MSQTLNFCLLFYRLISRTIMYEAFYDTMLRQRPIQLVNELIVLRKIPAEYLIANSRIIRNTWIQYAHVLIS